MAVGGEPDQWLALQIAHDALADAGALELPEAVRAAHADRARQGHLPQRRQRASPSSAGWSWARRSTSSAACIPSTPRSSSSALRDELQQVLPPLGPDTVPGLIPNIIVGRIANRLDLMGPAYTVDAACASSLVAIQHAVRDLLAGDCDLALAGGSQVWMPVADAQPLLPPRRALAPASRSARSTSDADGTLLGEGIGMVVLKRAEDAARDGDRVYAVIRGVGVASDGRGAGVMAPRRRGRGAGPAARVRGGRRATRRRSG